MACKKNRVIVNSILGSGDFSEYREFGWNDKQAIPMFSNLASLDSLYKLLVEISYGMPEDDMQHAGLMMALDGVLAENPNMVCSVYAFAGPWSGIDAHRGLSDKTPPKIKNLFQGSNAATNYPGVREIKSSEHVTIQIHRYNLRDKDNNTQYEDVPVIAVHIPQNLRKTAHIENI